jgi:hypothetical protein
MASACVKLFCLCALCVRAGLRDPVGVTHSTRQLPFCCIACLRKHPTVTRSMKWLVFRSTRSIAFDCVMNVVVFYHLRAFISLGCALCCNCMLPVSHRPGSFVG